MRGESASGLSCPFVIDCRGRMVAPAEKFSKKSYGLCLDKVLLGRALLN